MAWLPWINDTDLISSVSRLLNTATSAKNTATKQFGKNVIDPFAALFEISGFEIDYNTWKISETARQAQKTLQNQIGEFHQYILGHANGWVNKNTGSVIDLENSTKKIIAEVKNKYNTISGGDLSNLYYTLESLVDPKVSQYKGYTVYYVTIIPKKNLRFDKPFTPSDKRKGVKCPPNILIREIDGSSFYELVTGDPNALFDLFNVIPKVIAQYQGAPINTLDPQLIQFYKQAFG